MRALALALVILFAVFLPALADPAADDLAFLDGLSLVVLETEDISSLHAARDIIHAYGGRIALMTPPSILIGWLPDELHEDLPGRFGIRRIYRSGVEPDELGLRDASARALVRFYDRSVRGEIRAEHARFLSGAPAVVPGERKSDAFAPPPLEINAYLENLRRAGVDVESLLGDESTGGPRRSIEEVAGNSDFMTGTVALTIFFVESDGSGADPDLYTWPPEHMQNELNQAATGLLWWASRAADRPGCWVTFLMNYHSGADPRCQQWVEPILHESGYQSFWINSIMTNFGYTSGNYFTKVNAFNTWQRSYYQTDRSYSAFIPYNPSPAPTTFTDGATAYAYLGGPFTVILYRSAGAGTPAQVFAHESGHIFFACDEYAGGCDASDCTSVCKNEALNANCEACNPNSRDCMMKANTYSLCQYTPTHVGWEVESPCAPSPPPALPAPGISSASPAYGYQGLQQTLTIEGSNFASGVKVGFGGDIFPDITTLVDPGTIELAVTVLNTAPAGLRDITVTNRDGQSATLPGAFEVKSTTRHYFSPTGGDLFPYITPATAAAQLGDAMAAAANGDTLFVPTMTFSDFSLTIEPGVLLHGGWNGDFTARDLATGKTVFDLDGNVTVNPASENGGLDGFIVRNGAGKGDINPFPGFFGGGVRILSPAARIANCEIRSNAATGVNPGYGGGIHAQNSAVSIENNVIEENSATRGGGIYLYNCSGAVVGNVIAANTVSGMPPTDAYGGAIMLENCASVLVADNTITNNTGAKDGGGIQIKNSTGVTVTGGSIARNSASFSGGGVNLTGSTAEISGVELSRNFSAVIGGAIQSTGSNLALSDCRLLWNQAAIGAGLYAPSGSAEVAHNLLVGNSATVSAGGLSLGSISGGEVVGNTLDRNGSPGAGGMLLPDIAIEVFNNVVVNSTGVGITTNGSSNITLSHNLSWNNSGGDYSGADPGPGSISNDPALVDTSAVDYHLGLHSPAIDAGKPGHDDPDGSPGDLGWYGSHAIAMDQPSYPKNLSASYLNGSVRLLWDGNPEPDVASYAVYSDSTSGFQPALSNFVALVAVPDTFVTLPLPGDSAFYRIAAIDADGYASGYSGEATFSPPTGIEPPAAAYRFALHQNAPNPFNPTTSIAYEVGARGPVSLAVYDVDGRLVRKLLELVRDPGRYSVEWDGRSAGGHPVATGIYFCRLQAGTFSATRKMILLK